MLHLFLRGRSYSARFLVPVNLRATIHRREIWKSLGTRSYSVAKLRAGRMAGNVSSLFSTLLQRGQRMDKQQIDALIRRWTTAALEAGEMDRATGGPLSESRRDSIMEGLDVGLDGAHEDLLSCNYTRIASDVDELLQTHNLPPMDHESDSFKRLSRELLKAQLEVFRVELDRWNGDYTTSVNRGNGGTSGGQTTAIDEVVLESLPLADAIPLYLKHFEHRAPGTIEAKHNALKRFLEVVGNKSVHTITKADCIEYRDTLQKVPTNITKRFPGKSLREVLALKPTKDLLSKNTVNQDLLHIGHFFTWLIDEGKRSGVNPVDGISFDGLEYKSYEPFTDSDISTIFNSPDYVRQLKDKEYARHFIPLICLYSGCRREEVANLAVSDIKQEEDIWYMDIAPDLDRGRRLKNKASRRRVPVHSHLIELGLLQYVEFINAKGANLLFPKTSTKGRASVGDSVSKWLARTVKQLKVPGKKTLHGLRPTVATQLHKMGVDGETRRELLGHSGKDIHEQVYLRLSLPVLSQALEKLDYRALLKVLPVFKRS